MIGALRVKVGGVYVPAGVVGGSGQPPMLFCTFAARPPSPIQGQEIFETDTGRMAVWTGAAWVYIGENPVASGSATQYWRGDKSWQTLDKTAVGLDQIDNTSDINKPTSTAQQNSMNAGDNARTYNVGGASQGTSGQPGSGIVFNNVQTSAVAVSYAGTISSGQPHPVAINVAGPNIILSPSAVGTNACTINGQHRSGVLTTATYTVWLVCLT
jgi:hypothetical protein